MGEENTVRLTYSDFREALEKLDDGLRARMLLDLLFNLTIVLRDQWSSANAGLSGRKFSELSHRLLSEVLGMMDGREKGRPIQAISDLIRATALHDDWKVEIGTAMRMTMERSGRS